MLIIFNSLGWARKSAFTYDTAYLAELWLFYKWELVIEFQKRIQCWHSSFIHGSKLSTVLDNSSSIHLESMSYVNYFSLVLMETTE